ncbi:MAG: hypothetical protein IMY67_01875 [Bacteroidetes bacterium]|nr:hypothetical protein [Bacteroidota bacterium]
MDILDLLKDKKGVIDFLLETIDTNAKSSEGLRKIANIEDEKRKTQILLEVVANQSVQIKSISVLLLCYAQGSNFDSDISTMMIKMGRGREAVQQLFKNKFDK